MKIGKYKINSIQTGFFALDGGAMFGVVPKSLWERTNTPDEKNRIKLGCRCLYLQSDSKKILIDTGIGSDWDGKFNNIYRVEESNPDIINALVEKGINPAEITDVILTHLHFDHTGGSTYFDGNKFVPTFPNAKYHVQQDHFDWARNPSEKDRASFVETRFIPLVEEGILNLLHDQLQFDDEIEFILINGHTFAQQMIKISDSSETLLYCADLMPTSSHVPVPYVMGYDLQPLVTIKEKKEILPRAVKENWKIFFEHDPEYAAVTIQRTEKGFAVKEKFTELI
ncbi:MAG: MBL fold metallo-hydrolase [Ignavibacteria bacterium]|jgi:glyoxylase-like metal-dependent hydrolase (beta-lactamase superfamily II)